MLTSKLRLVGLTPVADPIKKISSLTKIFPFYAGKLSRLLHIEKNSSIKKKPS